MNGNGYYSADSPSQLAARSLAGLAHDVVTLGELQAKLALCDAKQATKGLVWPAVMITVGLVLLLGGVFTLLVALGWTLVEFTVLSRAASFAISAAVGIVLAALLGLVAYYKIKGSIHTLDRSRQELTENIRALKQMLKHHETARERAATARTY